MDQAWKKVHDFHQTFSIPHADTPKRLSTDRVQKRAMWMLEEIEEFQQSDSVEEQADAMIDTIYFALGTLVEMGVRPEALFDIVHEANMSKCWENGKPRYRAVDGKVIKPPTWQDPTPRLLQEIRKQKNQKS